MTSSLPQTSNMLVSCLALLVLVALLVATRGLFHHHRRSRVNGIQVRALPPGPRGWPIVGNLLDFPTKYMWLEFQKLSLTYGNMTFLWLMNTPVLVISSAQIAMDLMEKRSAIYSDKPAMPMDELTGWDMNLGIMPYGKRWRSIRACFHRYFNSVVTSRHHETQTNQIHAFLRRTLEQAGQPSNPLNLHLTLAATMLNIVYGLEVHTLENAYVKLILEAAECFIESKAFGRFWVDFLPILKHVPSWVPGAAAAKLGARCRPIVEEAADKPFREIKSRVNAKSSMASDLLMKTVGKDDVAHNLIQEKHIRDATGVAYVVGSDTTYSFLQAFFCVMAMNSTAQKKAQTELEAVVGSNRLPSYEDYVNLPYIQAVYLECLRWFPVTPLSVPRRLTTDDYYNGYFIPKGTLIIPNLWQMLRDPQDYPDPESFNPDRFLKDGMIDRSIRDPSTITFGFGRRICPGRHLAKDTAFLLMASVLHVFDISPSLDENGVELDPTPRMTSVGVLSYPDRANYRFKPRSEAAEKLIRATAATNLESPVVS